MPVETSEMTVGRLVRSRAGRDKDDYFLLVEIVDSAYVLISDGLRRKVERPKKKKRKHLYDTGLADLQIGEMLQRGTKPTNEQVAQAVRRLSEQLLSEE